MKKIKKTVFTLNVDDYAPEICELTYPYLKAYAEKIGADFFVITERKFPEMPPVYEKMQIWRLGHAMGNDWNIYIDSDALVHPETVDFTSLIGKDTVMHNGFDMASIRWKYDQYFLRDGRNIGSCNWLAIASDWCMDLWQPLDLPLEEALKNIYPTPNELANGITREHLIDDYTLSRNIARFGLKFKSILQLNEEVGPVGANFFWHQYTIPVPEKIVEMKKIIKSWSA
jgi:hypothetical protein